ncbi:hypothetical protein Ssi02_29700 [Sinosporangium siamense]|uniref:Uncharacterized protein n=1 Tax=Sinosporangium siamense TaxID=1367973 RepID=A0A919RIZ0_9ACTN|nr:hypothetical protein Ssi02_29700 [Sinosporangium siamense]
MSRDRLGGAALARCKTSLPVPLFPVLFVMARGLPMYVLLRRRTKGPSSAIGTAAVAKVLTCPLMALRIPRAADHRCEDVKA